MSYQPEPEKSADPNAQYPAQPPAYQTEPPQDQYPPPGQYPPQGYPPPGQKYPPTAQYDQQQATVTVVAAPVATRYVATRSTAPAPDYLTLTIVGMLVCCICGGLVGMVVLIPALICSLMASSANSSRDYDTARKLGQASLVWNIIGYIFTTLVIIAVVVAVVVVQLQSASVTSGIRVTCRLDRFGRTVCG